MRIAHIPCALALLIAAAGPAAAQTADDVVNRAIVLVKQRALNAPAVDWPQVESQAAALVAATPGEAGRTAAIRHVLKALGDGHSFYRPPRPDAAVARKNDAAKAPPSIAEGHAGPGGYGHLTIRGWSGEDLAQPTRQVRNALNDALAHDTCGLIVDVSTNSGGNMWPMMGGIAPLYDEGPVLSMESRDGARMHVDVLDGQLRRRGEVFPAVDGLPAAVAAPRAIAVVLTARTASSGEILALGFKQQANVRFFGAPTAGATTSNWSVRTPNGGLLAITASRLLDRGGTVQTGPLIPDEPSETPLSAAAAWLDGQCR